MEMELTGPTCHVDGLNVQARERQESNQGRFFDFWPEQPGE